MNRVPVRSKVVFHIVDPKKKKKKGKKERKKERLLLEQRLLFLYIFLEMDEESGNLLNIPMFHIHSMMVWKNPINIIFLFLYKSPCWNTSFANWGWLRCAIATVYFVNFGLF